MELPETSLDKLTAAFKALGVKAPSLLTKIGMLRSLFNEIEAAKKDGYSYGLILETLTNNGFKKTTLNQFYGLMNRLRLELGFSHLVNKNEERIVPAAPDLLDRSRRSGDVTPQKIGAVVKVDSENNEAEENDNPLIANGIGTSLQKVASEPKVKLTFNNRNREIKS